MTALSDLGVTEFLALARVGYVPCGLVVGSCFYDARWQATAGFDTGPLRALTGALREARRRALGDMRRQADEAGAEGVVGVRLELEHHRWRGGHHVARFLAVGTAIRCDPRHVPPGFAGAPSLKVGRTAFTSDLSGQEFALLLRAGYRPITLASGNCVYQLSRWSAIKLGSVEIEDYTRAYAEARETAMSQLIEDAKGVALAGSPDRPVGVVGMKVTEGQHGGEAHVVEFVATGTAVAALSPSDRRRRAGGLEVRLGAILDD